MLRHVYAARIDAIWNGVDDVFNLRILFGDQQHEEEEEKKFIHEFKWKNWMRYAKRCAYATNIDTIWAGVDDVFNLRILFGDQEYEDEYEEEEERW